MVSTADTYPLGPGIFAKAGVVTNPTMLSWLTALRARVPSSIPLVVTDGQRTPWTQATAMLAKMNRGENLRAIYKDDAAVDEVVMAGRNPSAMAAVISNQIAKGRFLSRHLTGDALDLRTAGMGADELNAVVAAAQALGASTLVESDHLHVERLGSGWFPTVASALPAWSPSPTALIPVVGVGGGIAAAVVVSILLLAGTWFAFFRR
jgi:hypothetical protein